MRLWLSWPALMMASWPRTSSSSSESWPGSISSRAERSRYAAKMRRDKEGVEIATLSKLLPYPDEIINRLDKVSIIRLTTSYLRMKKFSQREGNALLEELNQKAITAAGEGSHSKEPSDVSDGALMLQALNGFIIFVSRKGKIFYVSDNVGKQMGIHQYEMIGNSMMDFVHPENHKELAKQFVVQVPGQQTFKGYGMENVDDAPTSMSFNCFDTEKDEEMPSITDFVQERQFFLRMRSVMSRRGSGGKGKVMGYRVVNFCGRLKLVSSSSSSKGYTVEGLICLCRPVQPQPMLEVRMDGNMFMSRHSLDMCFTFCDPRIITLIGYEPHELVGKTVYQFHNPLDARKVSDCHSNLIVKGTSATKYYRFMGKNCSWVWLQTKATIIYNTNNVAQYIVCMNYVIGKDVGDRHLMMEEMAKSKVAGELCDSDCSDSIASPSMASPSCVDSPGTSGIWSSSEIDEPAATSIKTEMDKFDVTLIPKAVRENEQILKPSIDQQDISFASLLKMDNLKMMYGVTEKMDTTDKSSSSETTGATAMDASCSAPKKGSSLERVQGPFSNPPSSQVKHENQTSFQRSTSNAAVVELPPLSMQNFSPISETGSLDTSTLDLVSSPPVAVLPKDGHDTRMASVGEEEENLFKDLLELTKDEGMDSPLTQLNSDLPRMSFSVNSPSNLSQLMTNQSAASVSLGMSSPESLDLLDDCIDEEDDVFSSKSSGILAGLLAKSQDHEPASNSTATDSARPSMEPPLSQDNVSFMTMSITNVHPIMIETGNQLPEDIANFSLEFCQPVMDQAAIDAIQALGGELYPSLPTEIASNGGSATITEINDLEDTELFRNPADHGYQAISTAVTQMSSSPTQIQNGILQGKNHAAQASSVGSVLTPMCQEHLKVTERISQLDIQDSVKAPQMSNSGDAPILHALLLESRTGTPSTDKTRGQRPPPLSSNGLSSVSDVLGPITPRTKAAVDAVDSLIQDLDSITGTSVDTIPTHVNGNNNMANQENFVLLQQLNKERQLMAEEHCRQQQILMEKQVKQQKLMEEKQQQLLQSQSSLQSQSLHNQSMEQAVLRRKLQQKMQQQQLQQHQLAQQQQQQLQLQQQQQQQQQVLLAQQAGLSPGLQGLVSGQGLPSQCCSQSLSGISVQTTKTVSAALPFSNHLQQQQQQQQQQPTQQYSASTQGMIDPFLLQYQHKQQHMQGNPFMMTRTPQLGSPSNIQQQHILQQQQQPIHVPAFPSPMQQPAYCRQQQQNARPGQPINPTMFENLNGYSMSSPALHGSAMVNPQARALNQSDLDFGLANGQLLQHQ